MKRSGAIICLSEKDRRNLAACPRPMVVINMSMTADGKIATANRVVSSFGSRRDLANLYELRATADAVMCGARTIDTADVTLGPGPRRYRLMRGKRGLTEHNLRVVVSASGSVKTDAALFRSRFSPIIVFTSARASMTRLVRLAAVANVVLVCGDDRLDLPAALGWLRKNWRVRRLLCEGGGELNASLFQAGFVDELHLTVCPYVFGGRRAPTIAEGIGVASLRKAAQFSLVSASRVQDELFCVFKPAKPGPGGAH